jgi:hypothetical protein
VLGQAVRYAITWTFHICWQLVGQTLYMPVVLVDWYTQILTQKKRVEINQFIWG